MQLKSFIRNKIRPPRYRLVTLFAVVTLVSVGVGVWAQREHAYRARVAAVAVLYSPCGDPNSDDFQTFEVVTGFVGINGIPLSARYPDHVVWRRWAGGTLMGQRLPYTFWGGVGPEGLQRDDVVTYVKWPYNPRWYVRRGRVVRVTDKVLAALLQLPTLAGLELSESAVEDAQLREIAKITSLDHLDLSGTKISDEALRSLARLRSLRCLDLNRTKITSAGLRHLTSLRELEDLYLSETVVGDAGARHLGAMQSLHALSLDSTGISDAGLAAFSSLDKLEELSLARTAVGDHGVSLLAGLQSLRGLNLTKTKITGDGLARLPTMPQLESLLLEGDDIRGDSVRHLERCPRLSELNLEATPIGDSSLEALGRFPSLFTVNLRNCRQISGKGLMHLAESKSLRRVFVEGSPVTEASVAKLKALNGVMSVYASAPVDQPAPNAEVVE
jgi:hypothetical protein